MNHKTSGRRFPILYLKFLISKIANQKSKVLCALCLCCILGCYGAKAVKIKVAVDSKVDMKKCGTIAVLDFIDSKSNSITADGRTLARMIRKQLRNSKELNILDERSMYLTLNTEIDKDKIEDPKTLALICDQMGVGAVIVGTFDFRQVNQPMPYIVERYSPTTGKYSPETRTYVRRSYRLLFHAKVVDGATGATVFDYAPRIEDRPEFRRAWGLPFSGRARTEPTSLRGMAARPVTTFVLNLVPHYEYERRMLAR